MRLSTVLAATMMLSALGCGMDDEGKDKDGKKPKSTSVLQSRVIYGEDNRADIYQIQDSELLRLARSTVALMEAPQISKNEDGSYTIHGENFGTSFNLCSGEPYREQDTAAFCSGFLVGPKTVVTAGHCVRFASDCSSVKFVFDYAIKSAGQSAPKKATADQVYTCAKILKAEVQSTGADYSVIELDRPVLNRVPLAMRTSGEPKVSDGLVVIGHPSGLPVKVAGGSGVRKVTSSFLVANLDTYGGNSGSAVFNTATGQVEGILVRGETDFVDKNGCRVSNKCPDSGCRGEDVTLIKSVLPYVDTTPLPPPVQNPEDTVYKQEVNKLIPDASNFGVSSIIQAKDSPKGRNLRVKVHIVHSYRGDLVIELVSPLNEKIQLLHRSGGARDNVSGTFGLDLPVPNLERMNNVDTAGSWTLKVYDKANIDVGILKSWQLIFAK